MRLSRIPQGLPPKTAPVDFSPGGESGPLIFSSGERQGVVRKEDGSCLDHVQARARSNRNRSDTCVLATTLETYIILVHRLHKSNTPVRDSPSRSPTRDVDHTQFSFDDSWPGRRSGVAERERTHIIHQEARKFDDQEISRTIPGMSKRNTAEGDTRLTKRQEKDTRDVQTKYC